MSSNVRVLILEDRPEDAELMIFELRRRQFDPEWRRADTESEFRVQLEWPPDVILADYNMPLLDAPRALELLREFSLDIPFIVVSGAIGEEVAVDMMRRGAADYLLKDRLGRLGAAVRRAIEERELREETVRAGQALRASEVRFYSFMNNNPALACIKDENGQILYVNNTCQTVWGLAPAECLGKTNHQLWPPDIAEKLSANDSAALNGGGACRTVEEVMVQGRIARQMLSFRFPFSEADGRPLLGMISIDISEQVRTQKALAAALASKEVLIKEVHHRVKNNLQIISSLLSMQAASMGDPSVTRALEENQERVQSMALIHDRLNGNDKPDQLDLRDYVQTLARDLFYSYGVDSNLVQLRFQLDPVWLPLSQATPCGLILNEILTNALKYAFPNAQAGEIVIELNCGEDNRVHLTVSDDGVGMPAGLQPENTPSLGLRIVEILRRQLDGAVKYEAGPDHRGTIFSLTFPKDTDEAAVGRSKKPAAQSVSRLEQTA